MSLLIQPTYGRRLVLQIMDGQNTVGAYTATLFKNDYTPDADSENEDMEDADFGGSGGIAIEWGTAVPTVEGNARMVSQQLVWEYDGNGPQTIYGIKVTNTVGSGTPGEVVILAGRFDTPIVLADGVPQTISKLVSWTQCACPEEV